jgi:hypothetical protein
MSFKKTFLVQLAVIRLLTGCQSGKIQINGDVLGFQDGDTICLTTDLDGLTPMTRVIVKDGHFSAEEMADSIRLYVVYPSGKPECRATFFSEPGSITVTMSNRPGESRVHGSKLNNEWQALNDKASEYGQRIIRLVNTKAEDRNLFTQVSKLHRELADMIDETAKQNSDNYLGQFIKEHWNRENL